MTTALDPYGLEYHDWQDPEDHHCSGCPLCLWWHGRSVENIRAERLVAVRRRRIAEGDDLTPAQAARQDDHYWNNQG